MIEPMKLIRRIIILVLAAALGTMVWRVYSASVIIKEATEEAEQTPDRRNFERDLPIGKTGGVGKIGGIGKVQNPYKAKPYDPYKNRRENY